MPRPKLGQHFLFKGSVLERIADAVCAPGEPLVVEIGPGRGALTERLLRRAARVAAVEIDPVLAAHLRAKFPSLELVEADVLRTDLEQWGPAALAGNLPYYITSPILERVIAARAAVKRAVFLVQKEVADRMAASPGGRDYGYLTVALRLFFDAEILGVVKPAAFHPPPKVDSAIVRLEPHDRAAELGIAVPAAFLELVGLAFRHKRKTLRNNLAPRFGAAADTLPEARLRAEQLTLESFAALYHRLLG
ncbi:MAG: 16S rRNA (adenine(1518)-N(6)/adenine(1519)-N(6))-dimethyltransferase RsmA [Bryobacteraceae bacterium]